MSGVPVARDVQMFSLPQKHLLREAYAAGEVPLWTPFVGTGAPLHATWQVGFFYPPNLLYAIFPLHTAFNLLLVFHHAAGGLFFWLLCRRLRFRQTASFVAAITWMMGGYFVSLLNLVNALQAATWGPAVAWGVLRLTENESRYTAPIVVALGSCLILAGEPQTVVLSTLSAVLCIWIWASRVPNGHRLLRQSIGRFLLVALVALGLVQVQVLPGVAFLYGFDRSLTLEQAAAFHLDPVRLLHLFIPPDYSDPEYAFGVRSVIGVGAPWLFSIYPGALFPLLLWFSFRGAGGRQVIVLSAVAVLGIVVSLGAETPVFPWLFEHVPGFDLFRFPEKYFFLTAFVGALLAAFGVEALATAGVRRADVAAGIIYGLIPFGALVAICTWPDAVRDWALGFGNLRMGADYRWAEEVWRRNIVEWGALSTCVAGLVVARARSTIGWPVFGALLAILVAGDLWKAHRHLQPLVPAEFYNEPPKILDHFPGKEVRVDYRYRSSRFDQRAGTIPVFAEVPLQVQKKWWQDIMAPNVGQAWGVLQQDAWDPLKLPGAAEERELHRILDGERRWRLLELHSVRYLHTLIPVALSADGVTPIPLQDFPGRLYRLENAVPRAYSVAIAECLADDLVALNRILKEDFDPRSAVGLIREDGGCGTMVAGRTGAPPAAHPMGDGSNAVSVVESSPNRVEVRLEGRANGYLILTDTWAPGWVAEVDGRTAPVLRANYFFRAVRIEEGDSTVVFKYVSKSFALGTGLSLTTLFGALVLWVLSERRRRLRRQSHMP